MSCVRLQHQLPFSLQVRKPNQSRFQRLVAGAAARGAVRGAQRRPLPACSSVCLQPEMVIPCPPSWYLNETCFMETCGWMTWASFPEELSVHIRLQGVTSQLEDVT